MAVYRFRLEGHLDNSWAEWLGNMVIAHQPDGTSLITGHVTDQAALFGVLCRIRDLGTPLLSLTLLDEKQEELAGTDDRHQIK